MHYFQFLSKLGGMAWFGIAAFWIVIITGLAIGVKNGITKAKQCVSVAWCFYSVVILSNALGYIFTMQSTGGDVEPRMIAARAALMFHGHCYALAATIIVLAVSFIHKESRKQLVATIPLFITIAILLASCILFSITF